MLDSNRKGWVESATSSSFRESETGSNEGEEKPSENKKSLNWAAFNVIKCIPQLSAHRKLGCWAVQWQGCCWKSSIPRELQPGASRTAAPEQGVFTCMGHLLLPELLCSLPLPNKQERDNSLIKRCRKRLCLTAEGLAGAESCYTGFVPQVLTVPPCFHHSRVQMDVTGTLKRRVRGDQEKPFVGWD